MEMAAWFDQQDWVERYSPFGVMKNMQGVNQMNALMDPSGSITALGAWVRGLCFIPIISLTSVARTNADSWPAVHEQLVNADMTHTKRHDVRPHLAPFFDSQVFFLHARPFLCFYICSLVAFAPPRTSDNTISTLFKIDFPPIFQMFCFVCCFCLCLTRSGVVCIYPLPSRRLFSPSLYAGVLERETRCDGEMHQVYPICTSLASIIRH